MLKRPLLWLIMLAMLLLQCACIASQWGAVKAGTPDFAALYGTALSIHRSVVPDYNPKRIRGIDAGLDSPGVEPLPSADSRVDTLHPPFEILLFLPLTFLSYPTAYIVWSAFNLLFAWLVLVVLWPYLPRLHPEFEVVAILYGTALPLIVCLLQGQDSILLLLLLSLAFSCLAKGKSRSAGYLLALGLFKFHLVLPIVAALLVARKWKTVVGFLEASLVLLLATFAVVGPRTTLRYIPFISQFSKHISVHASQRTVLMPNLRGLVSFAVGRFASAGVQSLWVIGFSVVLLFWLMAWISKFSELPIALRFSAIIVVTALISYHYYIYNSVILVIPLLLMANEFVRPGVDRRLTWMFAAGSIGICLTLILASFTILPLEIAMPLFAVESCVLGAVIFALPSRSYRDCIPALREGCP